MTEYRRFYIPEATWFFTVNLAERRNNRLLIENIGLLRDAFRYVKQQNPFQIDAVVIMPDHLHCILALPPGDGDYSIRWNMLKGRFSRSIKTGERISKSRQKRRERGIYPRAQVATPILGALCSFPSSAWECSNRSSCFASD